MKNEKRTNAEFGIVFPGLLAKGDVGLIKRR